jgi:sugar phosphate isomerase/epimerase
MKVAVSNIAWTANEEPEVAKTLQELGVQYVEIAPTKVWEHPTEVSDAQVTEYLNFWKAHGIEVVAFQSMLFGHNDLTVFDAADTRQQTKEYLDKFIALAGRMGAKILVFGSPKNRQVKAISAEEAWEIAKDFFNQLGDTASANHTTFCIEPNPEAYDCNFVTTAAQGQKLVAEVGNQGFGLHLDAAGMTLAGDNPHDSIVAAKQWLRHFHISAPYLGAIEEQEVKHQVMADALREIGYTGFVSIEMRPGDEGQNAQRVRSAVGIAQKYYQ